MSNHLAVRSILGTGNSGNTISYNNVTNDNSHSNTSNLVNNGQAYFHTGELPPLSLDF